MGKVVERKKNKKKGRPSLLDLEKRSLKQQQQQQQQLLLLRQKHNHKPNNNKTPNPSSALPPPNNCKSAVSTPLRRSTRHNPVLHDDRDEEERGEEEQEEDDDEDDEEEDVRREKKLKLVLKLPHNENSGSDGFDSNGDDHSNAPSNRRKRKIDAIADGSGFKEGNSADGATDVQEPGPSTPLPDKKLLLFILDRLQKKDTYGVFSEPVDPEDLPDYREVIEHPMDFGTIRKQLSAGSYMNLEQFEKDVFLICSNAMQYNGPDTIYFRQARSIQELAKKDFENLRQDSDDNEPEPKVVRRGRPPTKNLKKALQRLQLDRAASEFSSDATLATGPERTNTSSNDLRKGPHLSEKSGLADSSGRFNGSRNDSYLLTDSKFERNDDAAVSIFKGVKHGKRPSVLDDNRRNTYRQFHALAVTREASVWTTFDAERKQLMAVGLMSEHGYARSLARFAANIGSVAWKIASKRIERSLPPRVEFGPGWVVDNDIPPPRPLFPSSTSSARLSPLWPFSLAKNQSDATPPTNGSKEEMMPEKLEDDHCSGKQMASVYSATAVHSSSSLSSSSTSLIGAIKPEHETERCNAVEGMVSHAGFNILKSSMGAIRPRPALQMHQSPVIRPGMNGFNGTYGISHPTHVGKVIGTRPASYNFRSPQMVNVASRMDTNVAQSSGSHVAPENASATNSSGEWLNSGSEANEAPTSRLQPHSSRQGILPQSTLEQRGLSPWPKPDPIPPDLNVRFQGPGSPSSSRADPAQPDLALQL